MSPNISRDFSVFAGLEVAGWLGEEMALAEADDDRAVLWQHPSVPFLQFGAIELSLSSGAFVKWFSHIETGLYFHYVASSSAPVPAAHDSIFRTREIQELPSGPISHVNAREDQDGNVLEVQVRIGAVNVRFLAGEVEEQHDHSLRIVMPDECILVQVSGADV